MPHRKTLIGVSIAGHAVLFSGVFLAGVWDLDQLDYEWRSRAGLAVITPPADGAFTPRTDDAKPQTPPTVVVKGPRQPSHRAKPPQDRPDPGPSEPGTGQGPGDPTGFGTGEPCQDPAGCQPVPVPPVVEVPPVPPVPPPIPPPQVHNVTPQVLKGLRISGETAIHPPREIFHQMHRNGDLKTSAIVKLCISANGRVSSVELKRSTKYTEYDEAILAAARRWVYQPHRVNGTPVPACGTVTFQYEMK